MKPKFRRGVLAAAFTALLAYAPAAQADPLLITGGSVNLGWDGVSSFLLTGNSFQIGGAIFGTGFFGFPVGSTADLSRTVSGSSMPTLSNATIDGVNYSNLRTSSSFAIVATPFVASAGGASMASFSTPFTLTGRVRGFNGLIPGPSDPLFDVNVTGQGIATLGPLRDVGGDWFMNSGGLTLRFQPPTSQAPVPEPATLLLLSTGLAGWAVRQRRRNGVTTR